MKFAFFLSASKFCSIIFLFFAFMLIGFDVGWNKKAHLQWKFFCVDLLVDLLIPFSKGVLQRIAQNSTILCYFPLSLFLSRSKFQWFEGGFFIFNSKYSEITNVQSTLFLCIFIYAPASAAFKANWIHTDLFKNTIKSCLTFFWPCGNLSSK